MKSKDTTPEVKLRKVLYALGWRYRLHDRSLPGTPDLVFNQHKVAVFVHGCYWHRHSDCAGRGYGVEKNMKWAEKHNQQVKKDRDVQQKLRDLGWHPLVSWECNIKSSVIHEAKKIERVLRKIEARRQEN